MKAKKKIRAVLGVWFLTLSSIFVAQAMAQGQKNVYVADFLFDKQAVIQEDNARHGPLEGLRPGIFKQIDQDRSLRDAENLVQSLSRFLVSDLNEKGIPAGRVSGSDELASEGILVQGEFLNLDEGDPLKQAAVGFNEGAAKMEIRVMISELPLGQNNTETLDLQSSSTQKGPGGVLGLAICGNPYVLAAKFVIAKHAAEGDIRKLASEIAAAIQKHLQS